MNWKNLETEDELQEILKRSSEKSQAIYKHSTRCSVSRMVKKNLEIDWNISDEKMDVYFLDLLAHRDVSNKIARLLQVQHESPQLIVIKDGKAIYHASHNYIDATEAAKAIAEMD